MPNPPLYFTQSTILQLVSSFLSFYSLYNVVIENHFYTQKVGTAFSISPTCRYGIDRAWWCSLEWEDSLCACPHLSKTCAGTQVWKSHTQRTYLWAINNQINQQSQSWKYITGFWQLKQQKSIYEFSYPWFLSWQSSLLLWNLCGFQNIVVLRIFAIQHIPQLDRDTYCWTNRIKKPQGSTEQDHARNSCKCRSMGFSYSND